MEGELTKIWVIMVGLKLLECDKRGLYPNWDAANKMSVGLAEKLGYHFSHEYVVYKVKKEKL